MPRFSRSSHSFVAIVVLALVAAVGPATAQAEQPGKPAFVRTWERTDRPVAEGTARRTWMWGPQANTPPLDEPYLEGAGGRRSVQYFDKSRMEIATDPSVSSDQVWYVTNGLLVREMVTGRLQVGDDAFEDRAPAWLNVAGDEDDPLAPTYATFASLLDAPPAAVDETITATLNRYGITGSDATLAGYGVRAAYRLSVPGIDHVVAAPFWEFMNSAGTIWEDGGDTQGALFLNPFYATGYPISEAYWTRVALAGQRVDVLVQCFERRCLTYTPTNPDGWQVEAGNVGRHYERWRYDDWPGDSPAAGKSVFQSDLSDFAAFDVSAGQGGWDGSRYVIMAAGGAAAGTELLVYADAGDYPTTSGDEVVRLEVRLASGGPEAFACLVTRYRADDAGSSRYALCIDGHDTVSAVWETFDAGGRAVEYRRLLEYTAPEGLVAADWNTLEIATLGDRFWFLVNGDLAGTARHDGSASGWAGFYLVNDEASPATAEFRNLTVSEAAAPS